VNPEAIPYTSTGFWEKNPPIPAKDGAKDTKEKDGWWKEAFSKPLQMPDGRPVKTLLWRQPNVYIHIHIHINIHVPDIHMYMYIHMYTSPSDAVP